MTDRQGGGKPPPITGDEVHGWFARFSKPHPSSLVCEELASLLNSMADPKPIEWPAHPLELHELAATPWNFEGVFKAAQILKANLPIILSPFSVAAAPAGDEAGRAALIELQSALDRAAPYLQNPYGRPEPGHHRIKSWHVPAMFLLGPVYGVLVKAGHKSPGITRNSIVAGVLRLALERLGHRGHGGSRLTEGAIGQHLTRWLAESGVTTNDLAASVTKT